MRTFLVGLVCGASLCAIGLAWKERAQPRSVAATEVAVAAPGPCKNFGPSGPPAKEHRDPKAFDASALIDPGSSPSPASPAGLRDPAVTHTDQCIITDANVDEILHKAMAQQSDREMRSLQSEPRDPMWSAAMEQQVREGIARHALGDGIHLSKVECKTLFCDIEAEFPSSNAQEGVEAFRTVTTEVAQGLGMQVGRSGGGSRPPDGLVVDAYVRFRRFKPGDECPPGLKEDCWNR